MSTRMMVAAGIAAAAVAAGAGIAMTSGQKAGDGEMQQAALEPLDADDAVEPAVVALKPPEPVAVAARPKPDCRQVATAETGFDPATTPYPVREDAGNKQVLKGTAAGAAFGAIAGEVIGDRAGYGAAAGAAAGAAGGQAIKKSKQNAADERYEQQMAAYQQSKAAYDAALQTCLAS